MFVIQRRLLALNLFCVSLVSASACGADDPRMTPLVKAVKNCRDFVVNIHTEKVGTDESDSRFFTSKSRRVSGMGTGIVVDERGYIVTNYHVIHEVDEITVTMMSGEIMKARPVSFDRKQDMAIIQVTAPQPLTVMPMGTSSDMHLAEQVFAVGNAFGYEYTVTSGIVSALGRDVEVDETQAYENLIQTDASINPGNSGGPLLNLNGEVIGINVAIRAGAQRIGFAIPIDDARRTISCLLSTERLNGITHGMFGSDLKLPNDHRLVVESVAIGSAADRSGLKKGDTIANVRGIKIHDSADWERSLLDMPVGKVLDVSVMRDGVQVALQFTVGVGDDNGERDGDAAVANNGDKRVSVQTVATTKPVGSAALQSESIRDKAERLYGLQIVPLSPRDRSILGRRYNGGMKIVNVSQGSLADRHGIRRGDYLLGLDGFETLDDRNLHFILQDSRLKSLSAMKFQIFRGNQALVGHMKLDAN